MLLQNLGLKYTLFSQSFVLWLRKNRGIGGASRKDRPNHWRPLGVGCDTRALEMKEKPVMITL